MNAAFRCEKCGQREAGVTDTRAHGDECTWRRRQCDCGHRFTTYEISAASFELLKVIQSGKLKATLESAIEAISEAA